MSRYPKDERKDPHPLAHHWTYWRRVAEAEERDGFPGLAEDYRRLAEHAERICRTLHIEPCYEVVP